MEIFTYDAANQNTVVLNPFSERATFSYDAAGRNTQRRLANGTRTSFIYDANSRRTQVDNLTSTDAAIETFEYQYDNTDNPTVRIESGGDRTTYAYDAASRLLAERRSGANSYANTFTYDATGNRTLKNADSVRTTYVYDVANQLTYSDAAGGRTTYGFDAGGNQHVEQPPAGHRTTTTWDYENQPTEYQLPDSSRVTLSYNADNRRVLKETAAGTTKFIWDPARDAYQSELDASDVTQAVYTQVPIQFGGLLSQRRGSTSHWYHPDSQGSTWALTDSSQVITDTYLYDAWGNPLSSSGTTVNPFRWVGGVGYYFDQESGLYYIRARVYQPTIARWNSVDPIFAKLALRGLLGSNDPIGYLALGWNVYAYALNNSLVNRDPEGLDIYIEGGGSSNPVNDAIHLNICVDLWLPCGMSSKPYGKRCFSFALTFVDGGCCGVVYEQPDVEGILERWGNIGRGGPRKKTTCQEDRDFLAEIEQHVDHFQSYNLIWRNCRHFSYSWFDRAPGYSQADCYRDCRRRCCSKKPCRISSTRRGCENGCSYKCAREHGSL